MFEDLKGRTITSVEGLHSFSQEVIIETDSGARFVMWHEQDCCETVSVNDVDGNESDLIGATVHTAEETSEDVGADVSESGTWTFYRIGTDKGFVVIRWFGESNGYYSESVSCRIEEIPIPEKPVVKAEPWTTKIDANWA